MPGSGHAGPQGAQACSEPVDSVQPKAQPFRLDESGEGPVVEGQDGSPAATYSKALLGSAVSRWGAFSRALKPAQPKS